MDQKESDQSVPVWQYYHVIRKHKWIVVASVVITITLFLLYNSYLEPIYGTSATLLIDKERMKSPLTGERMDYETYLSESLTFNTHFKLINSRPVMERVIQALKLKKTAFGRENEKGPVISPLINWLNQLKKNLHRLMGQKEAVSRPEDETTPMVRALQAMVSIEHFEDTRLLKLSVTSSSAQMAMDVANALAQSYIEFNLHNRLRSSQNTLSWITDQIYEMKKNLEAAEEQFLDFKQGIKLVSLEDTRKISTQKITEFNDAYIRTRNERLEMDAKLEQLGRISKSFKEVRSVRSLLDNQLINNLYGDLVKSEVELSRLNKVYRHKHPKMIQAQTQIENIRNRLNEEIKKELSNLDSQQAVLLSKEKVLQKTISEYEGEARETNKNQLEYNILQRNVETNQNLYDTLVSRLKEADITGSIDVSNIRITENAALPTLPVGPNKRRNIMLGALLGFMIGIGLSFMSEYLDRSIRTEEDVQRYLGLPVLSVIPRAAPENDAQYGQAEKKI